MRRYERWIIIANCAARGAKKIEPLMNEHFFIKKLWTAIFKISPWKNLIPSCMVSLKKSISGSSYFTPHQFFSPRGYFQAVDLYFFKKICTLCITHRCCVRGHNFNIKTPATFIRYATSSTLESTRLQSFGIQGCACREAGSCLLIHATFLIVCKLAPVCLVLYIGLKYWFTHVCTCDAEFQFISPPISIKLWARGLSIRTQ